MQERRSMSGSGSNDRTVRTAVSGGAVVVAAALIGVMSDVASADGLRQTWRDSSAVVRVMSQPVAAALDPVTGWSSSAAALALLLWLGCRCAVSESQNPPATIVALRPQIANLSHQQRAFAVSCRMGGRYGP